MQWLRDELQILSRSSDAGGIAASVPDTGGVYLVPAFAGLGAPPLGYVRAGNARGNDAGNRASSDHPGSGGGYCLSVLRRGRGHAAADSGLTVSVLRVDGGAASDDFLMQFQADMLGCRIERTGCMETTALGAAALAALALGWHTLGSFGAHPAETRFMPSMLTPRREHLLAGWRKAGCVRLRLGATLLAGRRLPAVGKGAKGPLSF